MKWADFTLTGRVITAATLWFVLAPFFVGLALGAAGFVEAVFWVTVLIGFVILTPLLLFVSAILSRLFPPKAPVAHGQFTLGDQKRSVSIVTRLEHRMTVMPPSELAKRVHDLNGRFADLRPVLGQTCQDCGHVDLLFDDADDGRMKVTTIANEPWRWRETRGIGLFAFQVSEIAFSE